MGGEVDSRTGCGLSHLGIMIMKTVTVKIDPSTHAGLPRGRVSKDRLDATSEKDIALQIAKDDEEAMQDAAKFARRAPPLGAEST